MPNYQNGKVYSIRSFSRPDLIYIGSTTQPLSKRFGEHKGKNNKCRSKQIVDLGDSYIELIENCSCTNKEELNKREGQLIRDIVCVNIAIPGRTPKEYRQDNKDKKKQYNIDNKEQISIQRKQYNIDNKEQISIQRKQYREENKDRAKQHNKQYNIDNKEQIKQRIKQYKLDNKEKTKQQNKQYYINRRQKREEKKKIL